MGSVRFLEHVQHDLDNAQVVIVQLPFEGTVSYLKGCASGPAALLDASLQLEDLEEELGWEPSCALRLHTLSALAPNNDTPADYQQRIADALAPVPSSTFVVAIGGEHTVSVPVVTNRLGGEGTVISIDAHPDLRNSYEDERFSHACAMRRIYEAGHRLFQIGLNCSSAREAQFVAAQAPGKIKQFHRDHISSDEGMSKLLEKLNRLSGPVYLSIDCDGLCPSYMPGTGTPMPGGLSWSSLLAIVRTILTNANVDVRGMDIVELRPLADNPISEFSAAKLLQKCLSYRFAELAAQNQAIDPAS